MMKFNEILEQKEINEISFLRGVLSGYKGAMSLKALKGSGNSTLKKLALSIDDVYKFSRTHKGEMSKFGSADDILTAISKGALTNNQWRDLYTGFLKSANTPYKLIDDLARDIISNPTFISKYSKYTSESALRKALQSKGYANHSIDSIVAHIKSNGAGRYNLGKTITTTTTTGKPPIKPTRTKILDILKKYGKRGLKISGIVALFGIVLIGYKLFSKSTTNDELQAILDDIKNVFPNCVIKLVLRLRNSVYLVYDEETTEIDYIYFNQTGIEEFDSVGDLKFYPDGRVATGDDTKTGTYTCKEDDIIITWDGENQTSTDQTEPSSSTGIRYKPCTEFPFQFGCKNDAIKEIQICLGFPEKYQTGNFGSITKDTLEKVGYYLEDGITRGMYEDIVTKCAKGERIAARDRSKSQMPPLTPKPGKATVEPRNPENLEQLATPKETPKSVFNKYKEAKLLEFNQNKTIIKYKGDTIPPNDLSKLDEFFSGYGFTRIKQKQIRKGERIKYVWTKRVNTKKIEELVKRNLQERYLISESFKKISLDEDEDIRFTKTIDIFSQLIDEGYDNENIERVVEEQMDYLKKLLGMNTGSYDDLSTRDKVITTGGGAAFSQFKEYLIDKVMQLLGFKGPLARGVSTALSEMKLMDLISVFKSREGCMLHSNVVAKGLLEGILRVVLEYSSDGGFGKKMLRNLLSEIINNSGYTKMIGQYVCTAAHKVKNIIGNSKQETNSNPQKRQVLRPPSKPIENPEELG